jgi:hypothetical protein
LSIIALYSALLAADTSGVMAVLLALPSAKCPMFHCTTLNRTGGWRHRQHPPSMRHAAAMAAIATTFTLKNLADFVIFNFLSIVEFMWAAL